MPLSANSLFHFTNTLDSLKGILEGGFHPRYVLEDYGVFYEGYGEEVTPFVMGVPMVCFCDLPLSHTAVHLEHYGRYGIGLAKTWGMSKGVSPILYVYPKSQTGFCLAAMLAVLQHKIGYLPDMSSLEGEAQILLDTIFRTKRYQGVLERRDVAIPGVCFYNEREWRYIPRPNRSEIPEGMYRWGMPQQLYSNETVRREANHVLAQALPLKFGYGDVKYIIVAREEEIEELAEWLESKFTNRSEAVRLISRIISTEQIESDF
jgi:hypothetical protein